MKKCWFYDPQKELEQMKQEAQKNLKAKADAKKKAKEVTRNLIKKSILEKQMTVI